MENGKFLHFIKTTFFSALVIYFLAVLLTGLEKVDSKNWWATFLGGLIFFYFIYCVVFNKDMYVGNYTIEYNQKISAFSLFRWFFAIIGFYYLYSVPQMIGV